MVVDKLFKAAQAAAKLRLAKRGVKKFPKITPEMKRMAERGIGKPITEDEFRGARKATKRLQSEKRKKRITKWADNKSSIDRPLKKRNKTDIDRLSANGKMIEVAPHRWKVYRPRYWENYKKRFPVHLKGYRKPKSKGRED
jgi:hypothetical protein